MASGQIRDMDRGQKRDLASGDMGDLAPGEVRDLAPGEVRDLAPGEIFFSLAVLHIMKMEHDSSSCVLAEYLGLVSQVQAATSG
uniref:Uncharacterized protein n=1 Tax=Knipowitschia caucasica TaxID=637954 RepID=A0AAV2MDY6_KNICA